METFKRNRKRRAAGAVAAEALIYAGLIFLALVIFLPSLWAVFTSVKPEAEVLESGLKLFPRRFTFENFAVILSNRNTPILTWFCNSVFIAAAYVVLYLLVTSLAAYAFARMKFRGREVIFWICMSSMVIPGVINLIPNYVIIDKLHLVDNPLSMILPGLSGVFGVFLLRQFMADVPTAYDEAAEIDGANRLQIYAFLMVPMCVPAFVTLAIFSFQGNWNDYMWPLIVTNRPETRTLTAGLATFIDSYAHQYGKLMAGALISALPVLAIFLVGQKYFIKGISIGGIKG